jgi:hypothetical protein
MPAVVEDILFRIVIAFFHKQAILIGNGEHFYHLFAVNRVIGLCIHRVNFNAAKIT